MRTFFILILFFCMVPLAYSQVDAGSDSADVGAPSRYSLDPTGTGNTVEVGRPYPYYYGGYGYPYGYGYGPAGVQALPDPNDPNYFPPEAALTTGPNVPRPPAGQLKAPVKKSPTY